MSAQKPEITVPHPRIRRVGWVKSAALLGGIAALALALVAWKRAAMAQSEQAFASQPEPSEAVAVAVAEERTYRPSTTSIGTIVALRSVTLRNEIPGTVRRASLHPGEIVEQGAVLVALDVSVEEAELGAQQAKAALAEATLERMRRASQTKAVSELEVDRAEAERDVAVAEIGRIKAVIARKLIRAPFRARVGISDVHPGQYLDGGTVLTTLQGVDPSAYVEFSVAQSVAATLNDDQPVEVHVPGTETALEATIVAIDARVDPTTRNALVRARIAKAAPSPGASVRVEVPTGPATQAVAIPVSALRKGPDGDHVFVIATDQAGAQRASRRVVQSGTVVGDAVVILDGLTVGERVATSGSFKLRESALVSIANATTTASQ